MGVFAVSAGANYSVTVGAGGTAPTGGTCSPGGTGGTSSFGSLISATGGKTGNGCGHDSGNGGQGSGGTVNLKGQDGWQFYNTSVRNYGGLAGDGNQVFGKGGRGSSFFGDPGNPGAVLVSW